MRMSDLSSVVCSSDLGTPLPSKLKRPEALAYDSESDVFYVAGGWSADLFKVSRSGEILEPITVLRDHRLPDGGHAVPKGLEIRRPAIRDRVCPYVSISVVAGSCRNHEKTT